MNTALIILSSFFLLAYLVFCAYIFTGWRKLSFFSFKKTDVSVKISVVVAFRNEAENLPYFLEGLKIQDYPHHLFEVIMVDDHSTDNGKDFLESEKEKCPFKLTILELTENEKYKKAALNKGIEQAEGELVVCTDADTESKPSWLSYLASFYETNNPDMILATVLLNDNGSIMEGFQKIDFLSLQLVTGSYAGHKNPILANGANLAFKKSVFQEVNGYADLPNTVSGDDFFLMLKFKKLGKTISFLPWKDTVVRSDALTKLTPFLNQRVRWAAKSKYARDSALYATGFYNTLMALLTLLIPVLDYINHTFPIYSVLVIFSKYLGDYILLRTTARIYQVRFSPVDFFLSFIFYPFYICYIFILSIFIRPIWKGRKI